MRYILFLIYIITINVVFINSEDKEIYRKMKNVKITSTFCDFRGDHFHTGIDLTGSNKEIYSISDGEVVFYNIDRKKSINYGNGNFIIVEDTKNKVRFSYSHINKKSVDREKVHYSKGERIADIGNSGYSTGNHLHLEVEDLKNKKLLNPLYFIENKDNIRPRIVDVYLITDTNKHISIINQSNYGVPKKGKLFIKCVDRINNSNYFVTPYRIKIFMDGHEKSSLLFDSLIKNNNSFFVNDKKGFNDIYIDKKNFTYFLMDYHSLPGIIGFKVVVEDFSGNKTIFKRALRISYK